MTEEHELRDIRELRDPGKKKVLLALRNLEQAGLDFLFACRDAYSLSSDDLQACGLYLHQHAIGRAINILRVCSLLRP